MKTTIKKPILASSFNEQDLAQCITTMTTAMFAATFEDENGKTQGTLALDIAIMSMVSYVRTMLRIHHDKEQRELTDLEIFQDIIHRAFEVLSDQLVQEEELEREFENRKHEA